MTEYRSASESVRIDDPKKHQIVIDAPTYGVVDSYRTAWRPGVFDDSLSKRAPSLLWGHQWTDPIGAYHDHGSDAKRLQVVYQLDDFDAVPRARQAFAQAQSGTIRDASFGFDHSKNDETPFDGNPDAVWINRAELQEHSMVLVGAVPGSKVAGVRNIPAAEVLRLAHELESGEMSLEEALAAVARVAGEGDVRQMHSHAKQDGGGIVNHSHHGDDGMHAHSGLMPAVRLGRAAAPYGDVEYADPGYQSDKQKRYPIDTEEHAKAAWSYINQAKNASLYSADDLASVKDKIVAALKKFGVEVSDRSAAEWETRIDGVADDGSSGVGPNDCANCGAGQQTDAKFCDSCGKPMVRSDPDVDETRALLADIAARS